MTHYNACDMCEKSVRVNRKRIIINGNLFCDVCLEQVSRDLMRKYINVKTSRNLTDAVIAKRLGLTRTGLISMKKKWELPIRKQKDNVFGVSEVEFKIGEKIGLSRKLILMRVRDYHWTVEKAIREPKDHTKSHKRGGNKNEEIK